MFYLLSQLWFFLFLAVCAGAVTGWMTCRKQA